METQRLSVASAPSGGAVYTEVVGGKYKTEQRREKRLLEELGPTLEGETPQVIFVGQNMPNSLMPWLFLVLNVAFLFLIVPFIRYRLVVVTNRRVHIYKYRPSLGHVSQHLLAADRPVEVTLTRAGCITSPGAFAVEGLTVFKQWGAWNSYRNAMKAAAVLAQQPPSNTP